jgi:hypothetical protein
MKLIVSKSILSALGLAATLSVMGTGIAQADPPFNECREIKFFDKIVFHFKREIPDSKYGKHPLPKDDWFDIKVPDRLDELANLKEKVIDWFNKYKPGHYYIYKDDIEIKDVDVAAVCVKFDKDKDKDNGKGKDD